MKLIVHGHSVSPFVRKVRVALLEKEIEHEIDPVNLANKPDWFVKANPLGRMPVLRVSRDGSDSFLPDSSVICAFLERHKPSPALLAADPLDAARALWIEEYADTELSAAVGLGVFRPLIVNPMMQGIEPDRAAAEKTVTERLPGIFDYLESQIGANGHFCENGFSLADIAVASQFVNLRHCGFTAEPQTWPRLAALVDTAHARSSFHTCLEEERPLFKATSIA